MAGNTWDGQVKSQLTNTSKKGFQNKIRETRHYKTNKWTHDRKFRTWQTANHRPPTRCPSRPVLSHQVTSPPHLTLHSSYHFTSHILFFPLCNVPFFLSENNKLNQTKLAITTSTGLLLDQTAPTWASFYPYIHYPAKLLITGLCLWSMHVHMYAHGCV